MHVHILGICGTFMGGIAAIAREAGYKVTGSDRAVYPPMSDQLRDLGVDVIEGFDVDQLDLNPDVFVIGNVMSRGMPVIEEILNRKLPFCSGPAWLYEHILKDRHVIAVSGTHGKTTTTSIATWILEHAGADPGYLVGGVPANFDVSARLGSDPYFVIEADEYDTVFFDKQAKFLNYRPTSLIINNIEFDHADIYKDLDAIQWQFHQLLRMLPGDGHLVANANDSNIDELLERGCWTPVSRFTASPDAGAAINTSEWTACRGEGGQLQIYHAGELQGECVWPHPGDYNIENALAALVTCHQAGISLEDCLGGLGTYRGVKRRMELLGEFSGVRVYDDFAHHPTAIKRCLDGARSICDGRLLAVLEPRSNTMKLGVHKDALADALTPADAVWAYQSDELGWQLGDVLDGADVTIASSVEDIVSAVTTAAEPGDSVVVMSNGGFGGIYGLLCKALEDG